MIGGVALGVALTGSTAAAQPCPKGTLHIYASWTMQGAMLSASTGMMNGVDMAVAEAGGVAGGYCLEVVHLDNGSPRTGKWDSTAEGENARRAVADPLGIVYIGPYNSGAARVSMPITNRASMAQITPGATYPGLTKSLDTNAPGEPWSYRPLALVNFFRPLGADDVQGTAGAKWAKRLGVKTVFVLNDDEAYGKGIANVFEVTARRFGLKISANENIDWRQPSQKPVLTRIVASGADLVYMGGVIETGAQTIVQQMREAGLVAPRVRFMGPDGLFVDEFLTGTTCDAALATEMRVTFPGLPPETLRGAGARTYDDYKRTFGKEPTAFALYAVAAGRVAVDGIRRPPPRSSAPTLSRTSESRYGRPSRQPGASTAYSTWSFDVNGDVDNDTLSGFRVVKADGPAGCKFQLETVVSPSD